MKKLAFLILSIFSFTCFSQTLVITTSGDTITAGIKSVLSNEIQFSKKINAAGNYSIPLRMVSKIIGKMPQSRINAIHRSNPEIDFSFEVVNPVIGYPKKEVLIDKTKLEKTAGDLISTSAQLRLTGFLIASGTSIYVGINSIKQPHDFKTIADINKYQKSLKTSNTIGIIGGVLGIILYISGESVQSKAGRLMNKNKTISFVPASEGIGVALKF